MGESVQKENWKACLEGICSDDILQAIKLERAVVDSKNGSLSVCFLLDTIVPYATAEKIKAALINSISDGKRMDVTLAFGVSFSDDDGRFHELIDYLRDMLTTQHPPIAPFCKDIEWSLSQKTVSATFRNSHAFEVFKRKKLNGLISEELKNSFGLQSIFAFSEGEEGQEGIEGAEEESPAEVFYAVMEAGAGNCAEKPCAEIRTLLGRPIKPKPASIISIGEDSGTVIIEGEVVSVETVAVKSSERLLCSFDITDYTGSATVKIYLDREDRHLLGHIKKGSFLKLRGSYQWDMYNKEFVVRATDIQTSDKMRKTDGSPEKRVELHLHTRMSSMDAVTPVEELMELLAGWGHDAVAVTDHGVVQAFPAAFEAAKKNGIKLIMGMEAYIANDESDVVIRPKDYPVNCEYVVFDLETTGLNPVFDGITEIAAVRMKDGQRLDSFHTLVHPGQPIPPDITRLTGITDEMVKDAPGIEAALPGFFTFSKGAALAAHNAAFDMSFLSLKGRKAGLIFDNPVVDTLSLARRLRPGYRAYRLDVVCENLGIDLESHHRASSDAEATASILSLFLSELIRKGAKTLSDVNAFLGNGADIRQQDISHATLLVKNQKGLMNLYRLVTLSHTQHFFKKPRIPRSLLMEYREGLLVGSACEEGEVFKAVIRAVDEAQLSIVAGFYDYLEIMPVSNNMFLARSGQLGGAEEIRAINQRIVALGDELGKPVVATGDVHFLKPEDEYFRRILFSGQGYEDADDQAELYMKTTEEMMKEFAYLGEEAAYNVVVRNTRMIADMVENIRPYPDKTYAPKLKDAEADLRKISLQNAKKTYGDPLPELVRVRLEKELDSIIGHGFATPYIAAMRLVQKSMKDGYIVGSRGSVGSSFVATVAGISEVNPLPPHYLCRKCGFCGFTYGDPRCECGADLQDWNCPHCGERLMKDGYDIPFEVFLGFKGDKVPDIDLNFPSEYQATAHKYTEELFGAENIYRAGTINTIKDKTAYGYVLNYLERKNITASQAEKRRLVRGCVEVKKTTGQHPGGIIVVPSDVDIHLFTPLQYPADDSKAEKVTTHFDFNSLHDRLIKLDILGHYNPTMLKMMQNMTGVSPLDIEMGERTTMSIFSSTKALGVAPEDIGSTIGTFGIPEFGTRFVRQMLEETRPSTVGELVRICGLAHGTNVWLNNAQELIRSKTAELKEAICNRDDIMLYLIGKGMDESDAFAIMESVRKGTIKNSPEITEPLIAEMRKKDIPGWFIDSCRKIEYLFPKAHATAYTIMAFRIGFFKVYHPAAFYAAYFSVNSEEFDAATMLSPTRELRRLIKNYEEKETRLNSREDTVLSLLEVILEMNLRGLRFLPVDIYKSQAAAFTIEDGAIRPPLNAVAGLGDVAARNIVEERAISPFSSVEDLQKRAKVNKSVMEMLRKQGCLHALPQSRQMGLF
ncbi:MAG: PolC-type DNA polymerase III [Bacillota bacterium]|nr:PolC-type DNA polymerase III [Bacillota bacterium]